MKVLHYVISPLKMGRWAPRS